MNMEERQKDHFMFADDLRCGSILNYVGEDNQKLITVIDWQDLKWASEDPAGFNKAHRPCVFDCDLLDKFGFVATSKYDFEIKEDYAWYRIYFDTITGDIHNGRGSVTFKGGYGRPFFFVHQFQNIYQSLHGILLP